ncbi:hypothetical protein OUZ56_016767 [Daphnia magna]|uniref:Uncharacterized protein n=1 Tax=Daphnia magna TaxID=35525 RepID=A0ABR0ARI0_9CRUS|nr:hypothetical protein OUZ56_016767 [Daphnia magna]
MTLEQLGCECSTNPEPNRLCKTMSCSDYANGLVTKIGPSPRVLGEGPPSGFDNFWFQPNR